jgi:hypothetical protein
VNATYPTRENISLLVQTASKEAHALSFNAAIPTKDTVVDLIRKAHMEMSSLNSFMKTESK